MERQKEGKYRKGRQVKVLLYITGGRRSRQEGSAQNRFLEMTVQSFMNKRHQTISSRHTTNRKTAELRRENAKTTRKTRSSQEQQRDRRLSWDGWASASSHDATVSPTSPPAVSSCGTGQEQDGAAFRGWTAGRAALRQTGESRGRGHSVGQAEPEQSWRLAELDRGRGGKRPMLCTSRRVARGRVGNGT